MQVVTIHAGYTVRSNDNSVIVVECGKSRVQYAGIRVYPHQDHVLDAEDLEQRLQISAIEAIKPFLVVDDIIGIVQKFGNDFSPSRTLDVVAVDRTAAPWGEAVFFGHHLV